MSNEANCANPECGHEDFMHPTTSRGNKFCHIDGCNCDAYVAPPERSRTGFRDAYARLEALEPRWCGGEFVRSSDGSCANCAAPKECHTKAARPSPIATPTAPPEVVEGLPDYVMRYSPERDAEGFATGNLIPSDYGMWIASVSVHRLNREYKAEIAAHARTKAELAEAVDAIREHLADGKHVGPRSARLRKIAATEGSK